MYVYVYACMYMFMHVYVYMYSCVPICVCACGLHSSSTFEISNSEWIKMIHDKTVKLLYIVDESVIYVADVLGLKWYT